MTQSGEHKGKAATHPPWTPEQVNKALGKKMQTQFKSVAKAFRSADENKNGTLDMAEFRWVLAKFNIEMDDAHFADSNNDFGKGTASWVRGVKAA